MSARLAGRTAWIIGGGSGLGAASALALAAEGAHVVVSGRRAAALEATAAKVADAGGSAACLPLDVAVPGAVAAAAATIGPVDILVYSSGTNVRRRALRDIDPAGWHSVVDVNLNGAFAAAHAVLPAMRTRRDGVIMMISSWAGWRLEPVAGAAYSATKRALIAFTEAINAEEGAHGVRASCICPAEVDTEVLDTRPVPPPPEARAQMLRAADIGALVGFIATAPAHMCVNEVVVSPTANSFYRPRSAA